MHTHHDKVNERNSIERNTPPVHHPSKIRDDHAHCEQHKESRKDVEASQDERDDENGGEADANGLERVVPHCEVLLVEDVED
jgi:hypothetical protein